MWNVFIHYEIHFHETKDWTDLIKNKKNDLGNESYITAKHF